MKMYNPSTHPFRVSKILNSSTPGCYGWRSVHQTYTSLEDAINASREKTNARKIYIDKCIDKRTGKQFIVQPTIKEWQYYAKWIKVK
jgi:hypothetical protein